MYQLWLHNHEKGWWMQGFYGKVHYAKDAIDYFVKTNKFDVKEWRIVGVIIVEESE